jgi:hypothetical protein
VPEVTPPLEKLVLPQVQVIHVAREKVPNPNYGMTFGQEGTQEPPFLEGDIESITILVPKAAEELLYFAVDNGTLHISIVPHVAVLAGTSPSTGVLWEDIVRFFQEERLRTLYSDRPEPSGLRTEGTGLSGLGVITDTGPTVVSTSPVTASGTLSVAVSPPFLPTPTPAVAAAMLPTPLPLGEGPSTDPGQSEPPGDTESSIPSTLANGLSGYLVPLCIGGGLAIGLGAVGFALLKRRR